MPKCPTKLLFNIDCPGCGFQRAIHAIIHGEFKRAFSLNPFLFLAAPYAIISFSYEPNILDVEAYYKNGEKTSHATTLPVFPFDLRSGSVMEARGHICSLHYQHIALDVNTQVAKGV